MNALGSRLGLAACLGVAIGALLAAGSGCDKAESKPTPAVAPADATDSAANSTGKPAKSAGGGTLLVDVTRELGFKDPQAEWPDGTYKTPEITPGGVALFDYDNDGDFDILQICHCAPGSFDKPSPDRLFQQQADGTFREVKGAAGLADPGFGHGVSVGDIDNDGDLDVYISNYGQDHLYVNDGKGQFKDVTKQAGIEQGFYWGSSVAFLDYDRDGLLDLYVTRFAIFDPEKVCQGSRDEGDFDYCGPHQFPGLVHKLYHNDGGGKFSDVGQSAGIDRAARGWGVTCADLTGDGWVDIYVANDEEAAQLWVNRKDGTFTDEAVFRGCAFNAAGRVEAGMGLALGDLDGDKRVDLFKTHIASETNTVYLRTTIDGFTDRTAAVGMGAIDKPYTGWGAGFVDIDHDGDLDVAVANGRVSKGPIHRNAALGKFWNRFGEPKLLFLNDGKARMTDATSKTGAYGSVPEVTRGMAFGDIDRDGDIDIVVCNLDNTLRIYRNDAPAAGTHWLIVDARTGKRHAQGAEVTLTAGGQSWMRLAQPAYSFLSSNDPRAHFGLGKVDKIDRAEILWPDGQRESFAVPCVDRVVTLKQGTGTPVE